MVGSQRSDLTTEVMGSTPAEDDRLFQLKGLVSLGIGSCEEETGVEPRTLSQKLDKLIKAILVKNQNKLSIYFFLIGVNFMVQ